MEDIISDFGRILLLHVIWLPQILLFSVHYGVKLHYDKEDNIM